MVPSQFHPHFIFGYCAVVSRKLVFLVVLVKQLSDILWNVCNGGYWCLFEVIGTVVFISKLKTPPLHTNFATHCFSLLLSFFFCSFANLTPILLKNFFCTLYFVKLNPSFIRRAGPSFSETVPNLHPAASRILFLLGFVVFFSSAPVV